MYSIEKEYDYKNLNCKAVEQLSSLKSIVCMEVSRDGEYIIAGYLNGYL